jgi:hypothetical protein
MPLFRLLSSHVTIYLCTVIKTSELFNNVFHTVLDPVGHMAMLHGSSNLDELLNSINQIADISRGLYMTKI